MTIFALHGFLGLPSDWKDFEKALRAQGFQSSFIAVDYMNLRGLTPDVSLDRWGENFSAWATRQAPKGPRVVLGYSLGGRLGLHALEAAPKGAWGGGAFLSTHPGLISNSEKAQRQDQDLRWSQRFQKIDFSSILKEWNEQPVFAGSVNEPERKSSDYDLDLLSKSLIHWSLSKQKNFREAEVFKNKTLWMAGQKDPKFRDLLIDLEKEKTLYSSFIEGASHRLLFDEPTESARVLWRFLQEL